MREWISDIARRAVLPLCVGLALGLTGPFGTYDLLPLWPRLAYWLAVVSFNWVLADAGIRRLESAWGARLPVRPVGVPVLGALMISIPATGVVVLANGLSGIGWPDSVANLYWKVLVLLLGISLPVYSWQDLRERAVATRSDAGTAGVAEAALPGEAAPDASNLGLFLARLPGPLPGRLLCLEMQDHYLAVHTTAGTELVLCRMEDAVRELEGLGRRVHRSWWVAEDAIEGVVRDSQRLFLKLLDGRQVPVGRTFRPALQEAGWLAGSSSSP